MMFPTNYSEILSRIEAIDPVDYGRTRNFVDGGVTQLSPYISRGVISTKQVFDSVLKRGYDPKNIEKFIQELAWRDYWQQVWLAKGDDMFQDLRQPQPDVQNHQMPEALIHAKTGIKAVDEAISRLYEHGYVHNHLRMYIASLACNLGKSHWRVPANWFYYHLLDGDLASNTLSWQWVSGANAGKKYFANQSNINKYCYTAQTDTFLDVDYSAFYDLAIPSKLKELTTQELTTPLPSKVEISVDSEKPTLLYNWYNLDPLWYKDEDMNRILMLEPSVFERFPISQNSINFMMKLAKNIPDIQIFVGEFEQLKSEYNLPSFIYKEHPLNKYEGTEEPRDWMFSVTGYYPSFFGFWKKCKKELKHYGQQHLF